MVEFNDKSNESSEPNEEVENEKTFNVVDNDERAHRQAVKQARSVGGMEKRWQDQDREALAEAISANAPPVRSEPRCSVCFVGGTIVRTRSGYLNIQDIKVGDEVLSAEGKWRRVNAVMKHHYQGKIYGVQTYSQLRPVWMTPEHPLLYITSLFHRSDKQNSCIQYQCKKVPHEFAWAEIQDIQVSDYLGMTKVQYESNNIETIKVPQVYIGIPSKNWKGKIYSDGYARKGDKEYHLDDDFLWAIGLYIAEGSSGTRSIQYTLHQKEIDYHQRLYDIWTKWGFKVRIKHRKDSKATEVIIASTMLAEWFSTWIGNHSYNKRIPNELMELPLEQLQYLLNGINDGDGKVKLDEIEQTSFVLALQLQEIALRANRPVTCNTHYRISKLPVFRCRTVFDDTFYNNNKAYTWSINNRLGSKIKNLYIRESDEYVYNLEVDIDNTYSVEGLAVHNCQTPHRLWVERQMMRGISYSAIARSVPDVNVDTFRRALKKHYQEHMDLEGAQVRAIMEQEADLLQQNYEEGVLGAFTYTGAVDIMIRKGFSDAMDNITTVEPKDIIKLMELAEKMNSASATKMVEEAKAAVNIFMEAIRNVFTDNLDRDMADFLSGAIVHEVKRLREQDELESQIEDNMRRLPSARNTDDSN